MLRKYSSYIFCLLISILVVTLYTSNFGPLARLEWKIQDMMYSFRGSNNYSSDIVLVNIDDQTLKQFGEWPWNRDKIADLVAAVGSGHPKTIMLDMLFDPDMRQDTSGYTGILAGQMSWTKNVILPYEISRAEFRSDRIGTPKYLYNSSIQVNSDLGVLDENATLLAQKVFLPPPELCQYSAGLGFKQAVYDSDRKIRWEPLVMFYEGYYYPSVDLIAAVHYLGIQPSAIKLYGGEYLTVGNQKVPIDKKTELFINYNKPGQSFAQISASAILNEKIDMATLKDKLAIISISSELASDFYQTPVSSHLGAAEKTANGIENIIHSNFMRRLDSSPGINMLILFLLGAIFAFILPRISLLYRLIVLIVSLFVLANVNFILFNSLKLLARPLYISLELILLVLASPILDEEFFEKFNLGAAKQLPRPKQVKRPRITLDEKVIVSAKAKNVRSDEESIKTVSVKNTPEKTIAGSKVMLIEGAEQIPDTTSATPTKMSTVEPVPIKKDAQPYTTETSEDPEEIHVLPENESKPESTPIFGIEGQQIKNLGRYKVLSELGKGAMGTVYKGTDPAINRHVALKTIRLDFVQDPEELAELKERLSREASAAGKLSHPNIVTIYDVGNEGILQYIAMEYLEGQTLENMIRRKVKFNYKIIAQIITQICSALDYAHAQGIVHRDIKPANIMVLSDYTIKVMDFGIARVDSSSMTRTGIAMGTPNYISPEQLQGKPVDHRTDIFSMGVVMYEMLVGRRPFRGENLTSLIYNIVNTEPEAPSSIDKSIPNILDRVIAKALKKNPEERYQKAGEIVAGLADFMETFSVKRSASV